MALDAACPNRLLALFLFAGAICAADEPAVAVVGKKCLACHNDKNSSSGLSFTSRASVLSGGARGSAMVPGQPQESLIVAALRQTGSLKMPPTGKLPDAEVELIEKWI